MDAVIGLGQAGCNIADLFASHSQYEVFKIDVGLEQGARSFPMPQQNSSEEYEKNCPSMKSFLKEIKQGDNVLFIFGGGGNIAGTTLRILETIKDSNISILYIKPDIELIGAKKYMLDRIAYYILQEYARSGLFERMFVTHNPSIEDALGEVPVRGYFDKLNEILVSTMHMINVFRNSRSEFENMSDPENHTRISTYGVVDSDSGEEKLFFPLDNIKEKVYYIGVNQKSLNDGGFFKKLKENMKEKAEKENVRISYSIHETKYEDNYAYVVAHSDEIQGEEKIKKNKNNP